jgi:hypothetical protein
VFEPSRNSPSASRIAYGYFDPLPVVWLTMAGAEE